MRRSVSHILARAYKADSRGPAGWDFWFTSSPSAKAAATLLKMEGILNARVTTARPEAFKEIASVILERSMFRVLYFVRFVVFLFRVIKWFQFSGA